MLDQGQPLNTPTRIWLHSATYWTNNTLHFPAHAALFRPSRFAPRPPRASGPRGRMGRARADNAACGFNYYYSRTLHAPIWPLSQTRKCPNFFPDARPDPKFDFPGGRPWSSHYGEIAPPTKFKKAHREFRLLWRRPTKFGTRMYHTQIYKKASYCHGEMSTGSRPF